MRNARKRRLKRRTNVVAKPRVWKTIKSALQYPCYICGTGHATFDAAFNCEQSCSSKKGN